MFLGVDPLELYNVLAPAPRRIHAAAAAQFQRGLRFPPAVDEEYPRWKPAGCIRRYGSVPLAASEVRKSVPQVAGQRLAMIVIEVLQEVLR